MDILKNESDDAGCILDKSNSAIIQDIVSTVNEIDTKYITSNFVPPEPGDFCLESTTIWSFPDRGCWATHNSKYRGNWSPYIPRNIILRYSKAGDHVLDQFVGSGTTLIEAKLLNRRGIGIDINPGALEIARNNLNFKKNNCYEPCIILGDARNLHFIGDKSIDLICTHPLCQYYKI